MNNNNTPVPSPLSIIPESDPYYQHNQQETPRRRIPRCSPVHFTFSDADVERFENNQVIKNVGQRWRRPEYQHDEHNKENIIPVENKKTCDVDDSQNRDNTLSSQHHWVYSKERPHQYDKRFFSPTGHVSKRRKVVL